MYFRKPICALLATAGLGIAAPAAGADVVLNEVNCEGTDWIELVNTSDSAADLSGWLLTDDPLTTVRADHRLHFADGTTIPAEGDLVVERGAGGFPFGISCGNDTIRLADATEALADEEAIPELTVATDTWGRYPGGTGPWLQTLATKGEPNQPSSAVDPPPGAADWLYDPGQVVAIDLDVPPASLDALAAATREDPGDYQVAEFTLTTAEGTYGPLTIGIRPKGGLGSFRPLWAKMAFRVKFNEFVSGQRFLGLKNMTLNNMVQDPSGLHELLAYEIFRAAGIPAPRTGYAHLRLNDSDYGLYLNLETPDDVMLDRWFESTRHLYEGELGVDLTPGGIGDFDVDEGSESDLSDLEGLIAAANSDGDFSELVASVADLDQMSLMWAVERYVGQWDGYSSIHDHPLEPNNYFLHSDDAGSFRMLPWGMDQSMVFRIAFNGHGDGLLFARCLEDPSCRESYRTGVAAALAAALSLDLDGLAATTANLLAPFQTTDPRREWSPEETAAAVAAVRAFAAARPGDAREALEHHETVGGPTEEPSAQSAAAETQVMKPRKKKAKRKAKRKRSQRELTGRERR